MFTGNNTACVKVVKGRIVGEAHPQHHPDCLPIEMHTHIVKSSKESHDDMRPMIVREAWAEVF